MKPNMSVEEAAEQMGVTKEYIRLGLQQKVFPFGTAVKMKAWRYNIVRTRFEQYMAGNSTE